MVTDGGTGATDEEVRVAIEEAESPDSIIVRAAHLLWRYYNYFFPSEGSR